MQVSQPTHQAYKVIQLLYAIAIFVLISNGKALDAVRSLVPAVKRFGNPPCVFALEHLEITPNVRLNKTLESRTRRSKIAQCIPGIDMIDNVEKKFIDKL